MKNPAVYIMANYRNGTLYIGVTSNLEQRVQEHKSDLRDGFCKKYRLHMLFYHEEYNDIQSAIDREKQIKHWNRVWKLNLIEKLYPEWKDLSIMRHYCEPGSPPSRG